MAHALAESGLEAGNLVIELTESTIMHNTEANLARLVQLKALGVRLAIDDFGTGYSSLSYLHRFPIDILKIDRSFVDRLANSSSGAELARAVITLSETLGLDTVAEGIEHEARSTRCSAWVVWPDRDSCLQSPDRWTPCMAANSSSAATNVWTSKAGTKI